MKFFVPQVPAARGEAVYARITDILKKQLRWPMTPRRIRLLKYTHDKRTHTLEVGELEAQESRYVVMAIFESSQYIVFTCTPTGKPGVIILVSKDDVTDIEDFDGVFLAPVVATPVA